jgi:hypothetical protein
VNLLPPIRFRFTAEDDVAAYGDGWWIYDEAALTSLPGRDLIALEAALDIPLPVALDEFRKRSTLGVMAAQWIALHCGGHPVKWNDFSPIVWLVELEEVPETPLGESSGESPTTDSDSSEPPTGESATSS